MPDSDRSIDGYRRQVGPGPRIRTDIVDVYVFTRVAPHANPPKPTFAPRGRNPGSSASTGGMESESSGSEKPDLYFLQLLRTKPPLHNTWHPVMGHIDAARGSAAQETASATAKRELVEELGLRANDPKFLGMWALEQVHPFFLEALDCIVMSPRFAVEVSPGWAPTLNHEHAEYRWVHHRDRRAAFMWPGQLQSLAEIMETIVPHNSISREFLRIRA